MLDDLVEIRSSWKNLESRINRHSVRPERIKDAEVVIKSAKALEKEIQNFVKSKNKQNLTKPKKTAETRSQQRRAKLPKRKPKEDSHKIAESLVEVLEGMDLNLSEELKLAFEIIDERFIQSLATNKTEYLILLKEFGDEFEEWLSGE